MSRHARIFSLHAQLPNRSAQILAVVWAVLLTGSSWVLGPNAVQAKPQNDSSVPTDQLHLWLRASDLKDQLPEGQSSMPLAQWTDRSAYHRTFRQEQKDAQPQLIKVGADTVVRFDGDQDFFRYLETDRNVPVTSESVTVFAVAAPHRNVGDFRGLFATNAPDGRDYETGINIDLGPGPSFQWDNINVEGRGFSGAQDLLNQEVPFGQLKIVEVSVDPLAHQVKVRLDGQPVGERTCNGDPISLAELTVAARYYTNGPGSQQPRSPFQGDLAELLVFRKTLNEVQRTQVLDYLKKRHSALREQLPENIAASKTGVALQKFSNPPLIQMLIPGFEVHELPVTMTNINNVRYRPDGALVTLGYNGDIHILRDSDGDGLEDQATLFWKNEGSLRGPIGLALTPENYPKGQGVFVPSKGKVSLIVDTNNDDKADQEIIVATGWPEIFPNVDALGICLDKEHNIYFGLGVADFSNAYQVGDDGVAKYNRLGDNGTIQKVSADFSKRETICTGIRFPVAMAFNQNGDLFCTEQEGATWLPNGNPLDELLWIRPDRHYGFPPRHPEHNPGVIDEPSVIEYSPQHQSTCGMVFNQPVNGGPVFGDANWLDEALVCGESRGKIWRTTLQKTADGYLAQRQLLACLQMLTIDACVSPSGDMIVCCHSGPPDWGTGPTGEGKLFRIRTLPADQRPARPVLAWQQSASEIRISFDRPVDPTTLQNLSQELQVHYGKYVRPGDQFETMVPPYVVVHRQLETPRFQAVVNSVGLTTDRRTLLIDCSPIPMDTGIAIAFPVSPTLQADESAITQANIVELDARVYGVVATRNQTSTEPVWLPHLNSTTSRKFTKQSQIHQQWFEQLNVRDKVQLETQLDLHDMLRPAIQPGATIDYSWPDEVVTVGITSSESFQILWDGESHLPEATTEGYRLEMQVKANWEPWVHLQVQTTGAGLDDLDIYYFTNEDSRHRVLPLERFKLPWLQRDATVDTDWVRTLPTELEGGNWGRGRQVFHSGKAQCFQCHQLDTSGGLIGPDLANLRHRDLASVMRDVTKPSFTINPDYTGQTILMNDGRVLTGILRNRDNQWRLGDAKGQWLDLNSEDIQEMRSAEISVMPEGLLDQLTETERKDLMTYLLMPPPVMPLDSPLKAPPLRSKAAVNEVLADAEMVPQDPVHLVLVAGPKDHGPGEHDYPAWQKQWAQLLLASNNVTVDLAWEFPSQQQLEAADTVIFFQKGDWTDERQQAMDQYFARGGGAVYLHWAVNGNARSADMARRIGLASKAGSVGYRHGPLTLDLHHTDDPIMRNLGSQMQLYDESYWELTGEQNNIKLLASSVEEGESRPQIWTFQPQQGRVFVCIPGHYNWTFDDPLFRAFLLRGVAWSARRPVDRFNELVPLGARISR